jgi:hypothetical protein
VIALFLCLPPTTTDEIGLSSPLWWEKLQVAVKAFQPSSALPTAADGNHAATPTGLKRLNGGVYAPQWQAQEPAICPIIQFVEKPNWVWVTVKNVAIAHLNDLE